jgi:RND family efflux transporter MFP subunit
MSVWKQVLLCLALVLAGVGAWYVAHNPQLVGLGPQVTAQAGRAGEGGAKQGAGGAGARYGAAILVVAAPVESDTSVQRIVSIGSAKAAQSVMLYPEVTGVVDAVSFTPGKHVPAGAVLVHLQDAEQKVALARAQATLAQAQAATQRAQRLVATKAESAVTLSNAETAQRLAETDVQNAQIALARRTIRAPFAGVPGIADLSVGDLVGTTTKLVSLDDLSSILVDFEVPERWAGRIAIGQPINGTVSGYPGKAFSGRVSAIDSRVDATARTLRLQATLMNDQELVKPGMAVTVSIEFPGEARSAVPSLALQWDRQGSFVWKLDGDVARRSAVNVLQRQSGVVIVQGGVQPGDQVAVQGVQRLRDGATVARAEASAGGAGGIGVPQQGPDAGAAGATRSAVKG